MSGSKVGSIPQEICVLHNDPTNRPCVPVSHEAQEQQYLFMV